MKNYPFSQVSRVLTYLGTWGQPVGTIWFNSHRNPTEPRRVTAILLFFTSKKIFV